MMSEYMRTKSKVIILMTIYKKKLAEWIMKWMKSKVLMDIMSKINYKFRMKLNQTTICKHKISFRIKRMKYTRMIKAKLVKIIRAKNNCKIMYKQITTFKKIILIILTQDKYKIMSKVAITLGKKKQAISVEFRTQEILKAITTWLKKTWEILQKVKILKIYIKI